jgi:DNA recombination protein RmuC
MTTTLAFIIGVLAGAGGVYFFLRNAYKNNESIIETIAAKVAKNQTSHILELAESKFSDKKKNIDDVLGTMKKDFKDELNKMEGAMKDLTKNNAQIDTRLESAAKVIKDLSDTTGNLKNALASNSRRGQWGERMAEDVLRLAGLMENVNYEKQKKLEGAMGSKPDFTFLLPQNLKLNMDVKFPFNNYQLYTEAKTEQERDLYKKQFLKDVRNRVKEIQGRDYINPENQTVDYVLLFVPNEQIFAFINEIDHTLIDEAMKAKTILCSPLSLYAILGVIRQSIDNFNLEAKSKQMLSLLGTFKMQWEKFKDQMATVKTRLESTQKAYEELTGARERQLDKPLNQLEDLRISENINPALAEEISEKITRKKLSAPEREETLFG